MEHRRQRPRMFSRNNKLDYQLIFRTRGAFRSVGSSGLIWLVCISSALRARLSIATRAPAVIVILVAVPFCLLPARLLIPKPLRRAVSLWSPMVGILLLYPTIRHISDEDIRMGMWTVYLILFVSVLILTVSRLQCPGIIKLVDWALGNKIVLWRPTIVNITMVASLVMLEFTLRGIWLYLIILGTMILVIQSFGNLQIPAAVLRIVLALVGIFKVKDSYIDDHGDPGNMKNLGSSLYIFYVMVLVQGILYIVAGIFETFSFILRRSLIRLAGFRGSLGMQYVNLYYAYAFKKCMEGAVLAPEKTSLITFAMDCLELHSDKMQLYGLKMLQCFLKKEPLKTKAKSKLTTSRKTVTCLINMLGWTSEEDKDIRSFAAMVTAEIADNLRVVPVPGAMQLIASLLHSVHVDKMKDPLLDIGSTEPKQDNPFQQVSGNEETSWSFIWLKQMAIYCFIPREEPTNMDEQKPCIFRCWKRITKFWSVPEEEPSTDEDPLPVNGMLILDQLASFDIENCIEISRATGLISKIIEFTSNQTDMTDINEMHQTMLKVSSLKLLRRLSSTRGKSGETLREKISEHPFLFSHLAEILDDPGSSQELRELTVELLRNLAVERNIKEEIGHIPVIISRLMHAFLSQGAPSVTDSDQLLRLISGQALALLATGSASNCFVILAEPGYKIIKELTVMIHVKRYRYIASRLLENMCVHARPELGTSDLKEISYVLREVLEGIMDAEGAELGVLVGLSSQICNVIPDDFVRELEHGQIKEKFIKRLVYALNSNMIPTAHCPGIRRVIVEHAIYMMECKAGYASYFKKYFMMDALLRVERTPSRTEYYRFFLGDAGLMEHDIPMPALVSRAKQLMSCE